MRGFPDVENVFKRVIIGSIGVDIPKNGQAKYDKSQFKHPRERLRSRGWDGMGREASHGVVREFGRQNVALLAAQLARGWGGLRAASCKTDCAARCDEQLSQSAFSTRLRNPSASIVRRPPKERKFVRSLGVTVAQIFTGRTRSR